MADQSYTGRYNKRFATSNLGPMEDEEPKFVAFDEDDEDDEDTGATADPRSHGDPLDVKSVDMLVAQNNQNHYTASFKASAGQPMPLVVRRGEPFKMRISFSRLIGPDDFQLEFRIGSGDVMMVNFGTRHRGSSWSGHIEDSSTPDCLVTVTPSADAIVGKFRTYVGVLGSGGINYTRGDNTDFYLLFNPWCPADTVFMPNHAEREEYVLNDYGLICLGTAGAYSTRPWLYAQFDEGILDTCIEILDRCRMRISDRGNAIKVTRQASEIINAQDNDNGVLEGNWGKTFPAGTSPLKWTGSNAILRQYIQSGVTVRYGQCWVFAAVLNTFFRCMGLPSRVVSNFNSAHDNDGNVKTDLLYKPGGTPHPSTRDSIWNFHCWNDVWMSRPDLPAGLGGWQCVDSTPQENSDGYYRCGPASVAAVKQGQVYYPYDTPFVFAEVNSDVIHKTVDKYGGQKVFLVEKDRVGLALLTKAVGSNAIEDITHTYKHPEGSARDVQAMDEAESYGLSRDHSETGAAVLHLTINTEQSVLNGDDVDLELVFTNHGDEAAVFNGSLKGSVVFYTGVAYSSFYKQRFHVTISPGGVETRMVKVSGHQYMRSVGNQSSMQFLLTGKCGGASLSARTVVTLATQTLQFQIGGIAEYGHGMHVEVSFVNPYGYRLTNVGIAMEGSGLFSYQSNHIGSVEAYGNMAWRVYFKPWNTGTRHIIALMNCEEISEVWGMESLHIDPPPMAGA
ncbi:unnamed protein product [Arctogadus glacialis]